MYDDAAVACGQKLFPVHRLVLSACSDYFDHIFQQTESKNSIIVLKDVSAEVFEDLLCYMYLGKVEVHKDKLGGLLEAAASLGIKGLAFTADSKQQNLSPDSDEEFEEMLSSESFPNHKRPISESESCDDIIGHLSKILKTSVGSVDNSAKISPSFDDNSSSLSPDMGGTSAPEEALERSIAEPITLLSELQEEGESQTFYKVIPSRQPYFS